MKTKLIISALTGLLFTLNIQSMLLPANNTEAARIVDTQQKTLVLTTQKIDGLYALSLYRYNTDNSLDNSFGTNGVTTIALGDYVEPQTITEMQNGKILVTAVVDGQETQLQFNQNGTLDLTFGTGGVLRPKLDLEKLS